MTVGEIYREGGKRLGIMVITHHTFNIEIDFNPSFTFIILFLAKSTLLNNNILIRLLVIREHVNALCTVSKCVFYT